MLPCRQEKVPCSVLVLLEPGRTRRFEGLAHVVSLTYDERFTPWFAVIDGDVSPNDLIEITCKLAQIQLEDGRCGNGIISQSFASVGQDDAGPDRLGLLYMSGLAPLAVPEQVATADDQEDF